MFLYLILKKVTITVDNQIKQKFFFMMNCTVWQ